MSGVDEVVGPDAPRGRSVAFYSYKGGVGRTMAVANVAVELALRHGMRVLAIDWDLETPGLHLLFGRSDASMRDQPGLLDYVERSREEFDRLQRNQAANDVGATASIHDFIMDLDPTVAALALPGSVSLMSAGGPGRRYFERLSRMDWREFYASTGGFWVFERLRLQATAAYDVVLMDSRAGRAAISGIPLVQMSDLVLIMFTPNDVGVRGTRAAASSLATGRHSLLRNDRPHVVLVPSPVRGREPDASGRLRTLLGDLARGLDGDGVTVSVPTVAGAAPGLAEDPDDRVGEMLVRNLPDGATRPLSVGYAAIADHLAELIR